jgi:hypothetical protein
MKFQPKTQQHFKTVLAVSLVSCVILFVASCGQLQHKTQYATNHFKLTLSVSGQVERLVDLRNGVK